MTRGLHTGAIEFGAAHPTQTPITLALGGLPGRDGGQAEHGERGRRGGERGRDESDDGGGGNKP